MSNIELHASYVTKFLFFVNISTTITDLIKMILYTDILTLVGENEHARTTRRAEMTIE